MATSDKFPRHYVSPCECGDGELVVDMSEPDYPFADLTRRNYFPRYECATCRERYRLTAADSTITVTTRATGERVRQFDAG